MLSYERWLSKSYYDVIGYSCVLRLYPWSKWLKHRLRNVRFYGERGLIHRGCTLCMFKDGRKPRFSVGWLMRFIAAPARGMITAGCILEAGSGRERERGRKKREPDTRLIISIFHGDAPDEKGRAAYPAAAINGRFYFADPAAHRPICFPFFFLFLFFFSFSFFRHRQRRHSGSLPNGPFSSPDWRKPAATFRARIYLSRS